MIEALLGSLSAQRVLFYITARDEGYAREIARFYEAGLTPIQKQLDKFEYGGVLVSRAVGRTRVYSFNPRYAFLKELKALLEKAISFLPNDEREALTVYRRRPRRKGKPL